MLTLETTGLLTLDSKMGGKTLVDAHNGFNDIRRLELMWMVQK